MVVGCTEDGGLSKSLSSSSSSLSLELSNEITTLRESLEGSCRSIMLPFDAIPVCTTRVLARILVVRHIYKHDEFVRMFSFVELW